MSGDAGFVGGFAGRTTTKISLAATLSPTFAHTTAISSSPEQAAIAWEPCATGHSSNKSRDETGCGA